MKRQNLIELCGGLTAADSCPLLSPRLGEAEADTRRRTLGGASSPSRSRAACRALWPSLVLALSVVWASSVFAARQMENLGRGVVAISQGDGRVFVSWRFLGTDSDGISFNLYRAAGNAAPVRLNQVPIIFSEDFAAGSVVEGVRFVNPFAEEFVLHSWL